MINVSYGMTKTLQNTPLAEAKDRVVHALKQEGFGVLTEIDVKATLKNKIDVDFQPYVILGACNPHLAHRALKHNPGIGLLLPCNIVVTQADDGSTDVSIAKPESMLQVTGDQALTDLVKEVTEKLSRVLEHT